MSYVLITPVKNEKENLRQLKTTILSQTLLPVIWIVVDSGSTDGSFELAQDLLRGYDWINIIHQRTFFGGGHSSENMSAAINEGYRCAKKLCVKKSVNCSYVGKTDATAVLEPDYFGKLYNEMEKDPRLGFACGLERLKYRGQLKEIGPTLSFSNTGYTDVRLYRRLFFDEVGGYPLAPFPDGCLQLKAAHRGWKYKIVEKAFYTEPRLGGTKSGVWAGYKSKGKKMYKLGYHPVLMFLHAIHSTIQFPPWYQIVPTTWGYMSGAVRGEVRIDDDEIRNYFGSERLREVVRDAFALTQMSGRSLKVRKR